MSHEKTAMYGILKIMLQFFSEAKLPKITIIIQEVHIL